MVVVAVETTALETVFEQLFDSQELTVIKVVCSFVEGVSEVILYTVVRSRENPEEVSSLVTLPVLEDVADEEGITLALFSDDMVSLEEFVLSV
ncbi:AKH_1a_G0033690.mRNA.1.CDS.1 [Saccharomyces cerevisiae]|nr:AKH_1a_G0033690.mRNA.1.CDS.1 [Saccharomyces cerevisiae]CAI6779366.1 AKH_1a_G0033690.mRNA.1.CDS.1 [Saccharomyces cerevisiae]